MPQVGRPRGKVSRTSLQGRRINEALEAGLSLRNAARYAGVPWQTLVGWLRDDTTDFTKNVYEKRLRPIIKRRKLAMDMAEDPSERSNVRLRAMEWLDKIAADDAVEETGVDLHQQFRELLGDDESNED